MKKLVDVTLAANDFGVLFSLKESVGGKLDAHGTLNIIEQDSHSELIRENETEGVIIYMSKKEYEKYKKQGEID